MLTHAGYWDDFVALVADSQKPWAEGADDSDTYREGRALTAFNLGAPPPSVAASASPPLRSYAKTVTAAGAKVANNLLKLNPTLAGWVTHVLVFVAPFQYRELGDPARRSCDACESLGASVKKLIRELTCRRLTGSSYHHTSRAGRKAAWQQTFSKGYIEQAFSRVSVRAQLLHGEENTPYMQRRDVALKNSGKTCRAGPSKGKAGDGASIHDLMEASTVFSEEMALAIWS